jgi:hypothetical protein
MIGTELDLVTDMCSAQKGCAGGFAAFHIAPAMALMAAGSLAFPNRNIPLEQKE